MKTLKESLFDSKTQTAMESLFDTDLVSKEPEMTVKYAVDLVINHIDKKFKIKSVLSSDFIKTDHFKPGNYCYRDEDYEDGALDMCHIIFYKAEPFPQSKRHLVGTAVSICISNEDDGVNLSRIDVGHMVDDGLRWPQYGWSCVWDGELFKTKSKLKSTLFNPKNIDKLFKYIDNLCQAVLDYPVDINSRINKNKFYF